MKSSNRRKVLWLVQGPPATFVQAAVERRLTCEVVTEAQLRTVAPAARALVIVYNGDVGLFLAQVRRATGVALDHGLRVCLRGNNRADFNLLLTVASRWSFGRNLASGGSDADLAEAIARFDPGGGAGRVLFDSPKYPVPPDVELLLARAFWDLEKVQIRAIPPGHSGAVVLHVTPIAATPAIARSLPYIVKIHDRLKIAQERESFEQFIADHIPFTHRPNIDGRRYIEGSDKAVLVQDFVSRAVPLRAALAKHKNPIDVMHTLLDVALKACRSCFDWKREDLVTPFRDLKAFRSSPELDQAAAEAGRLYKCSLDSSQLELLLASLPPIYHMRCRIHGDLHPGNVYVAEKSSEVLLIDFAKARYGPAVADPACLEIGLAWVNSHPIADRSLEELYTYPLPLPPSGSAPLALSWLWESVAALRLLGRPDERDMSSYALAVAAYLIRFASYTGTAALGRRALGYSCAVQILQHLKDDIAAGRISA